MRRPRHGTAWGSAMIAKSGTGIGLPEAGCWINNGEMDIGARAEFLRVQAAYVAVAVEHAAQSHALPCGAVPAEQQIPRVLASMKVTEQVGHLGHLSVDLADLLQRDAQRQSLSERAHGRLP